MPPIALLCRSSSLRAIGYRTQMSGTDKIITSGKFGQGSVPLLGQGRRQTKSP